MHYRARHSVLVRIIFFSSSRSSPPPEVPDADEALSIFCYDPSRPLSALRSSLPVSVCQEAHETLPGKDHPLPSFRPETGPDMAMLSHSGLSKAGQRFDSAAQGLHQAGECRSDMPEGGLRLFSSIADIEKQNSSHLAPPLQILSLFSKNAVQAGCSHSADLLISFISEV